MEKRQAKKLHNGDEVEVRIAPKDWTIGYIVGDVTETNEGVFANVQTSTEGYLPLVRHTDLR